MNDKSHIEISKKEIQGLVRLPTKGLELAVNILKENIVVAAKA